jgi:hypothetical protein
MAWLFRRRRSAAGDGHCQLSHAQLDQVFPFHARVDGSGTLLGVGPALAKLGGRPGEALSDGMALVNPPELSLEDLLNDPNLGYGRPLLFRCSRKGGPTLAETDAIELSGELLVLGSGELLLILSPRVDTVADLNAAGLSTHDLALHDGLRCRLLTSSMEAGLHELVEALKRQA